MLQNPKMLLEHTITDEKSFQFFEEFSENCIVELIQEDQKLNQFSEFYRAKQRFCDCEILRLQIMSVEEHFLDDLIYRLCSDDLEIEPKLQSSLFFPIIFRADFLQISDEFKQKFYMKICSVFILSDMISEILEK
ncbi:hypothetical protein HHI36_019238 [Cryptolaemus montrouzieri]|uniref:Uncharacterized protein n=1 Tax=Cryptolaemus montrouzieri TaxID=559131 RepID=A0ABD2P327_9CUCU